MLLHVLTAPHPTLKTKSIPVEKVDDEIKKMLDDMLETMYKSKGVGLAANQVGITKRIFVMDCSEKQHEPILVINPEITWKSEETDIHKEGCLSFPEIYAEVERAKSIKMKYIDQNGKTIEKAFDGIQSICAQHELDHLDGINFIDYLSKSKQRIILQKLTR